MKTWPNGLRNIHDLKHKPIVYALIAIIAAASIATVAMALTYHSLSAKSASESLPEIQSCIDNPRSQVTYYGDIDVTGWGVAHAGMDRVDVYVDDNQGLGSTDQFAPRPDVQQAVNDSGYYVDQNNGYSYTIKAGTLQPGAHTILVAAIDTNGEVDWQTQDIIVGSPLMSIDLPQDTTYGGSVAVRGWAVNASGVSRVDVYLDGIPSPRAFYSVPSSQFTARPDVQAAIYPDGTYPTGANCGFDFVIPSTDLYVGHHNIDVAAIGNDGNVQWASQGFSVGPEPKNNIDSPHDQTYSGDVSVTGWALSSAGLDRVDVYLDMGQSSQKAYSTKEFLSRPDVHDLVDPDGYYANSYNSGFSITIPASDLTSGSHTVSICAVGAGGGTQWATQVFSIG